MYSIPLRLDLGRVRSFHPAPSNRVGTHSMSDSRSLVAANRNLVALLRNLGVAGVDSNLVAATGNLGVAGNSPEMAGNNSEAAGSNTEPERARVSQARLRRLRKPPNRFSLSFAWQKMPPSFRGVSLAQVKLTSLDEIVSAASPR
jgi:hypothetical protein